MEDYQTEAPARHKRQRFDRPPETDAIDDNATLKQCAERRSVISGELSTIADDVDSIRSQLENAEIEQTRTGVPTDSRWKFKAMCALRYLHRALDDHRRAVRNLNARIRVLENRGEAPAFIEIAEELLEPDMFHRIWGRVRQAEQGVSNA
ncbi:MAG TPA: hypothetical protein VFE60_05330 [Roseiarcus sp.]|jgi:hypothetical protein|nr:hypothetical protein [Roseiarcus sp.]